MGVYVYQNEQLDKVAGLGYSVVDSAISSSSENPVQNKVVKEYVDEVGSVAYKSTDATDTTLADADKIPFYDASATTKKNITFEKLTEEVDDELNVVLQTQQEYDNLVAQGQIEQDVTYYVEEGGLSDLTASNIEYTDTSSIGESTVQGAIDKLTTVTSSSVTLNSTYVSSGNILVQKVGKLVTVSIQGVRFSSLPANAGFTNAFATGLPALPTVPVNPTILLTPLVSPVNYPIRLLLGATGTLYFHYAGANFANAEYFGTFSYLSA